jgi:hypothetical protein
MGAGVPGKECIEVVMQGWGAAVQVAQSIQRPSGVHVLVRLASAAGDVPGPGRIVVIRVVVVVGAGGAGAGAALPLGRAVGHGASINKDTGSVCGSNQCSNAAMWIMVLARHRVHVGTSVWSAGRITARVPCFSPSTGTRAAPSPEPAAGPCACSTCLSTWLHMIFTLHSSLDFHPSLDLHSTHSHLSMLSDSPPHLPARAIYLVVSANLQPRLPSRHLQATAMSFPYAACTFDPIHPVWS